MAAIPAAHGQVSCLMIVLPPGTQQVTARPSYSSATPGS
jgi:hypothetical protein